MKTIIEQLHEKGILCRGKPFAKNTVYRMLANEKYAGIYKHGDEIFTNMYPRIVPQEIFDTVKNKLDNNKYGKHKKDVVYLLKNKTRCGYCGKSVVSDSGTSKNGNVMRYITVQKKREIKTALSKPSEKKPWKTWFLKVCYRLLPLQIISLSLQKT